MKPIRWAVCGLGRISEVFIEVVGGMPGCEVVGCISADPARAEAYRQRHGLRFAAGYGDIERIGAQADAVYICTNMHLHRPNALGFLSAGIPCLVEKAFSLDLAEAEEMVACAKKNRTPLMEAMWTVFLPAIGAARALAASGALGKPLCASGFFCGDATGNPASRVFRRELGGGSILDLMVYNIACAQLFFGRPTDMTVTGVLGGGVDLSCDAVLDYGGVRADLHASLTAKSPAEHFTVVCERGTLHIPRFYAADAFTVTHEDGRRAPYVFEKVNGYTYQTAHFAELIRSGAIESPIRSFSDTLATMDTATRMMRALYPA